MAAGTAQRAADGDGVVEPAVPSGALAPAEAVFQDSDDDAAPSDDDLDESNPRVQALRAALFADSQKMSGMTDAVASFIAEAWDAASKDANRMVCMAKEHAAADDAKYQACVDWCKANGRYVDPEFPPEHSSLCHDWSATEPGANVEGVSELWREIVWRRPADILARDEAGADGRQAHVFDGPVAPDDIRQGELGDCYLLSALSVLAEAENAVEALFVKGKESDQHGVYVVRLCVQGHWHEIVLDELLPCFSDAEQRGQPIFSRGRGSELWVMLVEKAWAKVHGSYQAIIAGLPGECLTNLTGAPCKFVPFDEPTMWEKVYEATTLDPDFKSKGWFVVALLPLDPGYDLEELGLVAGHAYGVLDARQVTPAAGSAPVQLLQLRNPWGRFEWKGEYGPGSALWTPEARAQMKGAEVDDKGDGCFWMKTQDFSKYFAGVQICRASRGWLHTSEDVRMRPGRVTVLTLTVHGDKPVTLDISLLQSDRRMHYSTPEYNADSFEYLGVRIMVLAAETSEVLQHWPLTQQRDVWVEVKHLLPGKYWVLVETDWDGSARPDAKPDKHGDPGITIGVATLSDGEVELLTPRHCPSIDGGMIKEAALRYMCSTEQSPKDTVTYDLLFPGAARHASKLSKTYYAMRDTFAWYLKNKSHKLRLTERLPFELENMVIDGELPGTTEVTITLEPGQSRLLMLRQLKAGLPLKWQCKPQATIEEVD